MKINFYCEFPEKKNLEKLKLIEFPSKIFIAAHSIKEFEKFKKQAKKIKNNLEYAYWPLIRNSYWISPFSNTQDLQNLFQELNKTSHPLLIDLELPLLNKKLFLANILKFRQNKKLIRQFLETNKSRITTAQSPPILNLGLRKLLGTDYAINYEKGLMYYSSMLLNPINEKIKKNLLKIKNKQKHVIGLGTIAIGVLSTEPILSPENLEKDLVFLKKAGFDKACIFRLGGLNKSYMNIINKFI